MALAEAASMMAGTGGRIVESSARILGGEPLKQYRVRAKFLAAAMELTLVAQNDLGAVIEGSNDSANLDILPAIAAQVADFLSIRFEAHDGEAAFVIGSLGA